VENLILKIAASLPNPYPVPSSLFLSFSPSFVAVAWSTILKTDVKVYMTYTRGTWRDTL